ncbi:Zinc finger C2H2-type [Sesbania bispinosa]|nr:Zinc finger C2H2-type [Sesbania bispinosa]
MDCSGKKEENTMPVELAIQRELVYRRKVAASHLGPNNDSIEEILPLQQVKSSNQASHPMPLSSPSSWQFSSSNLSGTKRKELPTSSAHYPPLQHQQPFHGSLNHKANTDSLNCEICQVSCSSPFNLKQHLIGSNHQKKLSEKTGSEGRSNQRQWCELCKVSCMSEDLLKLHFQGHRHKVNLQNLEISKHGGEAPYKQKWCELCKLWCINEFSFKQHLEGKKHIIQLHAMEKTIKEKNEVTL